MISNKSATRTTTDQDTNDILVPVSVVAGYVWNSTPINGTDILRSIPVSCRELQCLIDINMNTLLHMNLNNTQATIECAKCTDSYR